MRIRLRLLAVSFWPALLAPVAATTSGFDGPQPSADEPRAMVYVYRTGGGLAKLPVFLDDTPIASLPGNRYFVVGVPPGPHALRSDKGAVGIEFERGHEYFVRVDDWIAEAADPATVVDLVAELVRGGGVPLIVSRSQAFWEMFRLEPLQGEHILDRTAVIAGAGSPFRAGPGFSPPRPSAKTDGDPAGLTPGTRVRVSPPGADRSLDICERCLVGSVVGTDSETLVVQPDDYKTPVAIPRDAIAILEKSRGRSRAKGALYGAAGGATVALLLASGCSQDADCTFIDDGSELARLGGMSAGVGALLGLALFHEDRWERIPVRIGLAPGRTRGIGFVVVFASR